MERFALTLLLIATTLPSAAQAQERLESRGVWYRVGAAAQSFQLAPEGAARPSPGPTLSEEDRVAQCDDLVRAILRRVPDERIAAAFERDRVDALGQGRSWVLYSQRHQGYRVVGAGARLLLDPSGRIVQAGLQFETEDFPRFRALPEAALLAFARRSVPHRVTGGAIRSDFVIDPMGDEPARLLFWVTFPILRDGREDGWRICVDATSGEVLESETVSKYLGDRTPLRRPPPAPTPFIVDEGGGEGGGGGGNPTTVVVHVSIGDCLQLEARFINANGNPEADILSWDADLVVESGTTMEFLDRSDPTTCEKTFRVNGSYPGLPYNYTPSNGDQIDFSSDCRPYVRNLDYSTIPICFNHDLSVGRVFPSDLTSYPTLEEWPIVSVSREASPSDILAVPCQLVHVPPANLTTVDNTRFDEVNAFYQAKRFTSQYLGAIGIYYFQGIRIRTKVPESPGQDATRYLATNGIVYLGEGDAYAWGAYPGKHYYDAAKYQTVLHHEIAHALFIQLYNGTAALPASESSAVEEGVCDFLAADYSGNSAVGRCYVKDYDHLRNCDNQPSDFRYSTRNSAQYPVGSGALAAPGSQWAQGMIVSGLLWDIRKHQGPIAAQAILQRALQSLTSVPNFSQFGSAVLAAATSYNLECEVRALLVAREFPGIAPTSATTPTNLAVSTVPANRCQIHATWAGSAPSYSVTWTPDGGTEQNLGTVSSPTYDGNIGTKDGGTLRVYASACGATSSPASVRREAVTTTVAPASLTASNETDAQGTNYTKLTWDPVPNAQNYRITRDGSPMGGLIAGGTTTANDFSGCAGVVTYCVEVVDCAGPQASTTCQTISRPGSPLVVVLTGPTSLAAGQYGTFVAEIRGGCGLAQVVWRWMTECDNLNAAVSGSALTEPCDTWYVYATPPLQTSIQKGFSTGSHANLKVTVTDGNGVTVTSEILRIAITQPIANGLDPHGDDDTVLGRTERSAPPRLEWDGNTLALVNVPPGSGAVSLKLFDIAGRQRAHLEAATPGSARAEFPIASSLSRGVYFARVAFAGGELMRKLVVLR